MINKKHAEKKDLKFHSQSGKSLIEVIVVVVIVTVVATFALAQYQTSKAQYSRQNVARQLKINMERARFDSVKRRSTVDAEKAKVIVNNSWFATITDTNENRAIDINGSDREVTELGSLDVTITGQNMVFPVTLAYDERGNVVATGSDGAAVNPVFYICNGTCTSATVTPANSNIVLVSPAGTVDLLAGNAALPTFSNPVVTNVDAGTSVNCFTAVSTAACTTATPTATATATPTATATVTPTETPTPTATPVPIPCQSNQKPALTGCSCTYPMTIKKTGKCN
jgi:prepilin-type N-terminal cleavage/methylation domain-containing protein